jgi:hypothetical protein
MSGVNPAAAAAAASAAEAAIAQELAQLAADAQALRALVMPGDVVQATVLPYNGLTDLLDIFGLRVAASLPPNVLPGDTLTIAVQGFSGDQVMVQVLSRVTASASRAQAQANALPASDTVELTPTPVPVVVPESALPPQTAASAAPPTLQPQAEPAPAGQAAAPAPPAAGAAPPPGAPVPVRPGVPNVETLTVEARLALARTAAGVVPPANRPAPAVIRGATAAPPSTPSPEQPPTPSPARPPLATTAPPPPSPNIPRVPFVPIAPRAPAGANQPAPLPGAPAQLRATTTVPPSQVRVVVPNAGELLQDPVALLRTLRIPVTPTALAFAKLVTTQPQQVATALRALETGLPNAADGRIATLRALAAFVGTLDPQSPTFTTQVTSFLTHVVEGPEPKLLSAVQPQTPAGSAPASAPAAAQSQAQAADATVTAAHGVERLAAADSDLKTQLVAVLASPQPESELGDAGAVIARNALTALVATQLGTLASQQMQPPVWTFTIPIAMGQQLYPAQIKVSRDKPEAEGEPLTGDDFHIAFILDTKRFGTVAIDLHAVQRAVSVAVRTDRPSAATAFKSALAQLGKRLQSMRYNVKSLEAGTTRVKERVLSSASPPSDELHAMDRRA